MVQAQDITVKVRSVKFNDTELEIVTTETGAEVKKKITEKLGLRKKIRIFFCGKEIADGVTVGNYLVKNHSILQLFIVD